MPDSVVLKWQLEWVCNAGTVTVTTSLELVMMEGEEEPTALETNLK
jgi:hypothetical protein